MQGKPTFIVPKWPSLPFWPLIFDTGQKYRKYEVDVLEFSEVEGILESGRNLNSLLAKGNFKGSFIEVRLNALFG